MNYRYIVVEGSIGSGKSALSRHLAQHFGALYLTENPEHNPFLNSGSNLAAELYFLLHRAEAVTLINTADQQNKCIITDFLLEKDQIFVPVILNNNDPANEQTLFWQIKQKIMPEYPVPDLVIYLQATTNIQKYLHKYPNTFSPNHLEQVQNEYRRFFHLYQNAPLLIANADELDFIHNSEHFNMLLHAMGNMQGSRHYLNLNEV